MLTAPPRRFSLRPRALAAALMLAATAALTACNINISNQAEGRSEWKKSYTLAAGGSLEIKNTNGVIEVDPSDGDTVEVTAERIAKAMTEADAKKAAEDMAIKETVSAGSILLDGRTNNNGIMLGGNREIKFHVRAPKGASVTLSTTNGALTVRDITGEVRLDTTNGRIKATNLAGTTRAETVNGEVDLDFAALGSGGVTVETVNGAVGVALPKTAKARVNVKVTNGGIAADDLSLNASEQSKRRLSGDLNGGGPEIRIDTVNGGVRLRGKS